MCLAIPGKVAEIQENEDVRTGRVLFGGIARQACLDFVPEVRVGDYVMDGSVRKRLALLKAGLVSA